MSDNILAINKSEQYRTVDELFEHSEPNSVYYMLLGVSSLIISCGILLNQPAIVIGGMLVTPVLSPLLVISLSLASGELRAVKRATITVLKSFGIIVLSSMVLAVLFGAEASITTFSDSVRTSVLYFIVAAAAGVAATFGWARKDIGSVLPGIAIAVSLVPPISIMGIGLSTLNIALVRTHFLITIFNVMGVLAGSTVVFSLLHFYRTRKQIIEHAEDLEEKGAKAEA
ncbi:hypothetical protein COV04_00480 [Candidatus Uhrbacteria bacterium CG10_big_fil_rev_8_21_14_0_10_48_11]|uniref:TIGR00341 family protein n=1 Tax=Candidatus Uhrbacteria bacterium CG10_big_fil_rev_8_21_14_0_10_48_11 TaxID=1975037 RepID=A0A2M8LFR5_9BACT|nr:MAG: hypothetical protein COV04_00480 [Candidatus Uhrbacteria bacterium CG10_big_fil_rev_8_21_14_0_10_48_11]